MSELVDISILPPVPKALCPPPVPTVNLLFEDDIDPSRKTATLDLLQRSPIKNTHSPLVKENCHFPVSDADSWSWQHRDKDLVRWRAEKSVIKDKDTDVEFNEDTSFIVGEEKKSWNEMFQEVIGSSVEATFGFSLFEWSQDSCPQIAQL
ncbi:hypothetical protein NEOLI_005182 [Neolecta irregularis DAH-3]|uniref:Uncharacterized protein n=1 Tax=Neolecta irregularis (strain DAH-3) TaxID=1198029 RepID=A0A1U7LQK0_NEOID|nr:hypothetical protein NEOLI_005182 [Neolecta irregularis DAH-3]|eukprot:OLL24950.1 hypothetical protein NEOLI_005182 [Neolecta irregularis DAH-3]